MMVGACSMITIMYVPKNGNALLPGLLHGTELSLSRTLTLSVSLSLSAFLSGDGAR